MISMKFMWLALFSPTTRGSLLQRCEGVEHRRDAQFYPQTVWIKQNLQAQPALA
jgi:hypothetical protein